VVRPPFSPDDDTQLLWSDDAPPPAGGAGAAEGEAEVEAPPAPLPTYLEELLAQAEGADAAAARAAAAEEEGDSDGDGGEGGVPSWAKIAAAEFRQLRAPALSGDDLRNGRVNVSDNTEEAPVGVLVAAFHLSSVEAVARAEDEACGGARVGVGDGLRKARAAARKAAAEGDEQDDAVPAGPHPCDGYRGDGGRYAALGFALIQLCDPFAAQSPRDRDFSFHRARSLGPRYVLVPIAHIWGKVRWFHHYDDAVLPLRGGKTPLPRAPPAPVAYKYLFSLVVDDPFQVWRACEGGAEEEG
jgi:hypothetical protein